MIGGHVIKWHLLLKLLWQFIEYTSHRIIFSTSLEKGDLDKS